jgi:deoxycytidine triphosphate deaminase
MSEMTAQLNKLYEESTEDEKTAFAPILKSILEKEDDARKEIISKTSVKKEIKKKKIKRNTYGYLSDSDIQMIPNLITATDKIPNKKVITNNLHYGLDQYGYTARLAPYYCDLTDAKADKDIIDPSDRNLQIKIEQGSNGHILLKPGHTILVATIERFNLPQGIIGLINNKDTYANCGVSGIFSNLEPGFNNSITFCLTNNNKNKSVKLYTHTGIIHVQFIRPFSMSSIAYKAKRNLK